MLLKQGGLLELYKMQNLSIVHELQWISTAKLRCQVFVTFRDIPSLLSVSVFSLQSFKKEKIRTNVQGGWIINTPNIH